ncbi:hypothetical protein, partial [Spirosoma pomorum]
GQHSDYVTTNTAIKPNLIPKHALSAGPGSFETRLSKRSLEEIKAGLDAFENILFKIDYKHYLSIFQAVRLVHLTLLTKREDFALGYSLLIAAIESVSQIAIKRDKVKVINKEREAQREKLAEDNVLIQELLESYKSARGNNQYLSERFVKFILDYCPVDSWEEMPHPRENFIQRIDELEGVEGSFNHIIEKNHWEKYPDDLTEDQIKIMLADSYKHRSAFIHTGRSTPHKYPQSHARFFEVIREVIKKEEEGGFYTYEHVETTIPNFDLMSFIAKKSIISFFEKKLQKR